MLTVMAYFEDINLGKYGENLHRYTMRCTDAYCSNIEEKIREFLSRSNRRIKIINITQYGASDGIYTTIWFGYLN